jgi:hypothetical protein
VQVDPIKPMLKAPGTKRLKLEYDKLLSSFAFNFNLRRYTTAAVREVAARHSAVGVSSPEPDSPVAYERTVRVDGYLEVGQSVVRQLAATAQWQLRQGVPDNARHVDLRIVDPHSLR